jgi:hypothetical protein
LTKLRVVLDGNLEKRTKKNLGVREKEHAKTVLLSGRSGIPRKVVVKERDVKPEENLKELKDAVAERDVKYINIFLINVYI